MALKEDNIEDAVLELEKLKQAGTPDSLYEDMMDKYLKNAPMPGYAPTREDHIRTLLVGGVKAIEPREKADRESQIAYLRYDRYRKVLRLVEEAQKKGLLLNYDVTKLREGYERAKEDDERAEREFKKRDHELCIRNYNAWRIENK